MSLTDQLLKIALLGSEWVLYVLLGLSVVSFTLMGERWWFFWQNARAAKGLRAALSQALLAGGEGVEAALSRHKSLEGEALLAAWRFRGGGAGALLDALGSETSELRRRAGAGMTFLGTVGNNAPFVGLFGTVIGVIEAFSQLGAGGGDAAMGRVMSLIAEALVATGVGIFVALPAVVAYNVAQSKIGLIEDEVESLGRLMAAWLGSRGAEPARSVE